ncbi:MAG: glycogen/starch/alpha-glucan phosphorylase [Gammaproteobacteria bacterium]|nr:glycogen/starch/alpha-glucan phosphorylase [Gammaproteobacteria bacterium]
MKSTMRSFKYDYMGLDAESIKYSLANRLEYSAGKDLYTATDRDWLNVTSYVVRDRLMERWMETMRSYYKEDAKRIYYLSLEFLIGRTLGNSLLNMGVHDACHQALRDIGLNLEEIRELEPDAALGNGGLGRLAACFLDSMATMSLPAYGYGIRYEYGMFTQRIENGRQVEHPENWLRYGNPWEFPRPEVLYPVKFHGRVVEYPDESGQRRYHWVETDEVMAMAYDTPIPGYKTNTVNNMRLWSAKATRDFDLKYFNEGNYIKALEEKNESENLSKVLYPDDTTAMGRELRLKQQYFFVSASLQDILRRFRKSHFHFDKLPDKVAIQLNDTHPVLAIPELMRLLMDIYGLEWKRAWDITVRTFSYTNHTLLPEALETWPAKLLEDMLPRHLQIIYEINHHFLKDVMHQFPGNMDLLRRMSIIDEDNGKRIRMAHLAVVGSHKVNGVAALHTHLMKTTIFADFHRFYPEKIINKTNGITPRRWLHHANQALTELITSRIGEDWTINLDELRKLAPLADDPVFRSQFQTVKRANKERLAAMIKKNLGVTVNVDSMFDIHIKRIHEYKRQLLNVLHVITLYNRIRANPSAHVVPRTVIFAGKAAPGYAMAKLIIKLINDVADIINNDPAVGDRLKVLFIPNYNVSTAETLIPASELSQQISTAGTEASGTGNMKLALNGALTIGTLDGANVEIREEVGEDNIFIFGLTTQQAEELRRSGYNPWDYYHGNHELKQVLDMIGTGYFSPDEPTLYQPVIDALTHRGDHYLLLADYASYIACQERVAELYADPQEWTRKAILNVAHMGKFSSDRTIREYAEEIWQVNPVKITLEPRDEGKKVKQK